MGATLTREDIRRHHSAIRAAELAEARIRVYMLAHGLVDTTLLQDRVLAELMHMIQVDDTDS